MNRAPLVYKASAQPIDPPPLPRKNMCLEEKHVSLFYFSQSDQEIKGRQLIISSNVLEKVVEGSREKIENK